MADCDANNLPNDALSAPGAVGSIVEFGYAETISLAVVDDTFTFPLKKWRSAGFYLKQGEADISFDGGSTYPASYDISDGRKVFGQGNSNPLDPSGIIVKATIIDTIIQTFGDYVE